jgi:CRISPR-associated protein Csm3
MAQNETQQPIRLQGRIILTGQIKALTGLHIGGSPGALAIGGVDLPVIRNPVNQHPYIPGSSLKGKMRSLWEKAKGVKQNYPVRQTKEGVKSEKDVWIHACTTANAYKECPVCQIYGTLGQSDAAFPTRIVVRDVNLDPKSLNDAKTDLPYSEVKWEAAIDRVTSAATPRQIERVPAEAIFNDMQIVFNLYYLNATADDDEEEEDNEDQRDSQKDDCDRFLDVLAALQLVEDDYLGGHGSRGSGRVRFRNLAVTCRSTKHYTKEFRFEPDTPVQGEDGVTLSTLIADRKKLQQWIRESIPAQSTGGA